MKARYDLTVTYLAENDEVKTESFEKVIFDYINDGRYFFVQEQDQGKEGSSFKNKLHWYPAGRIVRIEADLTRTFETKAEQLEYYKAKKGIPAKGNAIKN